MRFIATMETALCRTSRRPISMWEWWPHGFVRIFHPCRTTMARKVHYIHLYSSMIWVAMDPQFYAPVTLGQQRHRNWCPSASRLWMNAEDWPWCARWRAWRNMAMTGLAMKIIKGNPTDTLIVISYFHMCWYVLVILLYIIILFFVGSAVKPITSVCLLVNLVWFINIPDLDMFENRMPQTWLSVLLYVQIIPL